MLKTTAEHPFYAKGKGWIPAAELDVGDLLNSHDGQWVMVEGIHETAEYEQLHNLRIADHHTYFVGTLAWGFSVWSHNTCDLSQIKNIQKVDMMLSTWKQTNFGEATVYLLFEKIAGELLKVGSTAQPNTLARLERYVSRALLEGKQIELYAMEVLKNQRNLETAIRNVLGKINKMPWDGTGGRLNYW